MSLGWIEDPFKNKMNETKFSAGCDAAKETHAIFQCLALLLEERISEEEKLVNQREAK
ncbi:MAG: hypothetical protein RLZ97_117 [Verrucomicrobiota bacterium]